MRKPVLSILHIFMGLVGNVGLVGKRTELLSFQQKKPFNNTNPGQKKLSKKKEVKLFACQKAIKVLQKSPPVFRVWFAPQQRLTSNSPETKLINRRDYGDKEILNRLRNGMVIHLTFCCPLAGETFESEVSMIACKFYLNSCSKLKNSTVSSILCCIVAIA